MARSDELPRGSVRCCAVLLAAAAWQARMRSQPGCGSAVYRHAPVVRHEHKAMASDQQVQLIEARLDRTSPGDAVAW